MTLSFSPRAIKYDLRVRSYSIPCDLTISVHTDRKVCQTVVCACCLVALVDASGRRGDGVHSRKEVKVNEASKNFTSKNASNYLYYCCLTSYLSS